MHEIRSFRKSNSAHLYCSESEMYLTSSRFFSFRIFFFGNFYATLLLFKIETFNAFWNFLFLSLFGNGPGTDGDRFMIYVLLSAWFRSWSQCFISFARDLRRRTHQKMRWILKINLFLNFQHDHTKPYRLYRKERTYDLIGWERGFRLSTREHHSVDLVRCKTRFSRDCEKEPLNTLYMVRGINKLEPCLNILSPSKSLNPNSHLLIQSKYNHKAPLIGWLSSL